MSSLARYIKQHFLLVILTLAILLVLGWYGIKAVRTAREVNDTFNVNLARDAKTDKYIGKVASELYNLQTRKVIGYKIQLNSGDIIERTADSVIIFKP